MKLNSIALPLTTGKKEKCRVPDRSGLNWGQRPGRNQDQAYLSVPIEIQRSNFFPSVGIEFVAVFDDGFKVECVRAQQNGKAIHSQKDNAIIGRYFRSRLGLSPGDLIIIEHLERYGRTTVDVSCESENIYFFDFETLKRK
ncbi:NgoFVII family restriction endonuclease [Hyphomicrobiales bacterium]|jgi:hypothetical protein|nr:NgoFVII family restriction endonuclease [Hyphomicrobiales bacterium]